VDNQHFSLKQLQGWMQGCLLQTSDPQLQEEHGTEGIEAVDKLIAPSRRMSAKARLGIYQRGYFARLLECMSKQFSVLEHALGKDLFRDFSFTYLQKYPSNSFTLGELGTRFPDFLESTRPDRDAPPEERESWPDFMIELARLEWACFKLLEKDGRKKGVAIKKTDQILCYLPPAIELFELKFPSYLYYWAVLNQQAPDFPAPQTNCLALINRNYKLGAFNLNGQQFDLLTRLIHQQELDSAIKEMAGTAEAAVASLQQSWEQWYRQWIERGLLIPLQE